MKLFFLRLLLVLLIILGCTVLTAAAASSHEYCAHVVDGRAQQLQTNDFEVFATVRSNETGWDKYADEWRIQDENGTILGIRSLAHPHVTEQPFTRSLRNVNIPPSVQVLNLTARDSVWGYCGDAFLLELPDRTTTTAEDETSVAAASAPPTMAPNNSVENSSTIRGTSSASTRKLTIYPLSSLLLGIAYLMEIAR